VHAGFVSIRGRRQDVCAVRARTLPLGTRRHRLHGEPWLRLLSLPRAHAPLPAACYSQNCAPGRFSAVRGAHSCLPCAGGTTTALWSQQACGVCPAGSESSADGTECVPCRPGRFARAPNSAACAFCERGHAQPQSGKTACAACVPGRFSSQSGQAMCELCGALDYQPLANQSGCLRCPTLPVSGDRTICGIPNPCRAGSWLRTSDNKNDTATSCEPCPAGSWSADKSTTCAQCGSGKYSARPGSARCVSVASGVGIGSSEEGLPTVVADRWAYLADPATGEIKTEVSQRLATLMSHASDAVRSPLYGSVRCLVSVRLQRCFAGYARAQRCVGR
jgi:hypothetical protein